MDLANNTNYPPFDPNTWYQIRPTNSTPRNDALQWCAETNGTLCIASYDLYQKDAQWQFYPESDFNGVYSLYCHSQTLQKKLGVTYDPNVADGLQSQPALVPSENSLNDTSETWVVFAYDPDSPSVFGFYNERNGTQYQMGVYAEEGTFDHANVAYMQDVEFGTYPSYNLQFEIISKAAVTDASFTVASAATATTVVRTAPPLSQPTDSSSTFAKFGPSAEAAGSSGPGFTPISSPSPLSNGALAGAVVGAVAGAALLLLGAFFLFKKMRSRKKDQNEGDLSADGDNDRDGKEPNPTSPAPATTHSPSILTSPRFEDNGRVVSHPISQQYDENGKPVPAEIASSEPATQELHGTPRSELHSDGFQNEGSGSSGTRWSERTK